MILNKLSQEKIVMGIAAALFIAFSVTLKGFFVSENLFALVRNVSTLGILATAMALVVLGRGIDLSIVSTMAMSTAWAFYLAGHGFSIETALIMGLCFALLFGLINGLIIAYAEIPAIFCTLAMGIFVFGFVRLNLIDFEVVYMPTNASGITWIANKYVFGFIPMPVIFFISVLALATLFLKFTRPGQQIYSIGDNLEASRIVGIPVRPIIVLQYTLSSFLGYIAGIIAAMTVVSVNTRQATGTFIYDVLLVVVIGGISLSGGRGGIRNVIVGTLLIGVLLNGMTIMDIQYTLQNVIKSSILLLALIIDSLLNPRDEQTAQQGDI
ncbi:MAG: ABC transporter permease [Deltaproteobacteria bacterium HGW-Deltaproteobacteria-12]|jgi:ribose transport system permease protein|nr:MAG: ABC transporter permease [Deltaproteobacteria bacterium HGW-Deltaproteobacteria-12]